MRAGGRTDMKLIVVSGDFANGSKKCVTLHSKSRKENVTGTKQISSNMIFMLNTRIIYCFIKKTHQSVTISTPI